MEIKKSKIFGFNFYIVKNLLKKKDIKKIIKDINFEIKYNLCLNVALYQTHNNIHKKYIKLTHWKNYFNILE